MSAAGANLLKVEGLGISFGGIRAVDDVSFEARPKEIFTIIGPNGAGKTTLFNMVSGVYTPSNGKVSLDGRDVTAMEPHNLARMGMSRTFQNLQIFFRLTALENVMVGRHIHENRNVLAHLFTLPAVARQNRKTAERARVLLARIGLSQYENVIAGSMPYGALKRLEIARALATEPRFLLLDEPAAGCNPVETTEVEQAIHKIAADGVGVVLVEHDMKLVMKISDRILVLDQGRMLAEGGPDDIRHNADVMRAYLGEHGAREAARA